MGDFSIPLTESCNIGKGLFDMKAYNGRIKYNEDLKCYGLVGEDGTWVKPQLEDGDRILIEINGEVFRTDFKKYGNSSPVLEPLPLVNWDYLCTRPVQYQDFERNLEPQPEQEKAKKQQRLKTGFLLILFSAAAALLLTIMLCWLPVSANTNFFLKLWDLFRLWYLIIGVPIAIGGILTIIFGGKASIYGIQFGCGFWYGGMALSLILQELHKMITSENDLRLLAYIIAAGVCCAVWVRINKEEE